MSKTIYYKTMITKDIFHKHDCFYFPYYLLHFSFYMISILQHELDKGGNKIKPKCENHTISIPS